MPSILVVDDDPEFRDLLRREAVGKGIDLRFAGNGWEALLELDSSSTDLILLDLMMPGMDGPTFLKILRRNKGPSVPVAVLTVLESEEAQRRIAGLGASEVLNKRDVFGHLQEVIDRNLPSNLQ